MKQLVYGLALSAALFALCGSVEAAQAAKFYRIGLLTWAAAPSPASPTAFEQGLRQLGYVEGQNITIERRYANGQMNRLPELAVDLARFRLDVILTQSFPAARAAKEATSTIPIVVMGAGDPVATGLVASFAHPGGNITGVSALETELSGKRLELLKESFPKLARVAVLWNAADFGMTLKFREIELAAQALRVTVQASAVREPKDIDSIFPEMIRKRPDALFVITDPLTQLNRKKLVDLATKNRLPAMYENAPYVEAGGLMAYGPSQAENLRIALQHVDKILKGTKPSELPIEQPTKFEFLINLGAAKQIGLTIPPNVLARADKVIK
ncbi:MAG TPA: ABC transporter substrate-binding protein [Candidatus Binatia bacterium]|jgi:putative ABC transport system substrate-binding protein